MTPSTLLPDPMFRAASPLQTKTRWVGYIQDGWSLILEGCRHASASVRSVRAPATCGTPRLRIRITFDSDPMFPD